MKLAGKLGFIGGGRMAEAMIKGILRAELVAAADMLVADPDESRRALLAESYRVAVRAEADEVWQVCDTVVLAVKPQVVGKLLERYQKQVTAQHLLISIAAGIPLALIEGKLSGSGCRVVRVMPNTPAMVQESASALSGGQHASADDLAIARAIFDSFGTSVILDEGALDAVTGLSGSGPAYVFSFIEALIDAGIKTGLSRPVAEKLVLQTVLGSVKMAMESGEHPAQLRAMVTSPGGTTIAGLHVMARAGFAGIVMDAVEAATNRSRQLGAEQNKPGK